MDWLSHLLDMMPVTGRLEIRCLYGAPWRVVYDDSPAGEVPYHVVLAGEAIVEDPKGGPPQRLEAGDMVLLLHGGEHVLHDGSGAAPGLVRQRENQNLVVSENREAGVRLDMLCGRFVLSRPHERLVRAYLPPRLVIRASDRDEPARHPETAGQLAGLVALMRTESTADSLGGRAMLNALSAALFALAMRLASASDDAPMGLLALAGHPRLAPALSAMFLEPARPWTLPDLASLCNMSRATMARHFQEKLGRSASDLLTDIRMTLAAGELRKPGLSTETVAEVVGYQSVAAFKRAFKQRMGMTPADWRREARQAAPAEN